MIWEAIQRAKSGKLNLDVVWLDLANAYGSGPDEMAQLALSMYHVREDIQVMLGDYQFCSNCETHIGLSYPAFDGPFMKITLNY
ncbi:reverse transcriptase [Elysia marginata]|uniref:Reverse transcriptase n=1 Tax=Elysia marginata TaxID=1093978 RepID=A0AAV4HBN1_9GAST|nr:reverse transcriptase [Elysia marginata]